MNFTKSMKRKFTTPKAIEQIIISLKMENSCVRQDIHRDMENKIPFISSPLNYIHNKIIFCDVFQDRLKGAIIKTPASER